MTFAHIAKLLITPTLLGGTVLAMIEWRIMPKGERRLSDPEPQSPAWLRFAMISMLVLLCIEGVFTTF